MASKAVTVRQKSASPFEDTINATLRGDPAQDWRRMTEAERKLLIWCGIMLVRGAQLTEVEADEIDQLIAEVRRVAEDLPVREYPK